MDDETQPKQTVWNEIVNWFKEAADWVQENLGDPELARIATKGSEFLLEKLWDAEHGGFSWRVTREGEPIPDAAGNDVTQAYGQAFCLDGHGEVVPACLTEIGPVKRAGNVVGLDGLPDRLGQ